MKAVSGSNVLYTPMNHIIHVDLPLEKPLDHLTTEISFSCSENLLKALEGTLARNDCATEASRSVAIDVAQAVVIVPLEAKFQRPYPCQNDVLVDIHTISVGTSTSTPFYCALLY
jgi:hypothetical protein